MDTERKAFSFYRSYYEASKDLPTKEAQADFLMAICTYIFDGEEPELHGVASAMFKLAKPNLDTSVKRANAGQIGGSNNKKQNKTKANEKQNESKSEANEKQNESQAEAINDYMINDLMINDKKEKPNKKEKDEKNQEGWEDVFEAYEQRFPMTMSSYKAQQLKDIITNYGKEPVLYAIREASTGNAKQPIAYIRTVAMNYSRQKENDEKTEPKRESLEEIGKRIKEETEKARAEGKSMTPDEMKQKVIEEMKRKGMKIVGNSTPA